MKPFHDSQEARAAYLVKTYGMLNLRTYYLKKKKTVSNIVELQIYYSPTVMFKRKRYEEFPGLFNVRLPEFDIHLETIDTHWVNKKHI